MMKPQTSTELTCVIPTHNRPAFLRRLLTYWDHTGVPSPILIADSSSAELREKNQKIVERFGVRMPLRYEHFELGFYCKMAATLELVETPYVFVCADDDFILPEAATASLAFLRDNPDYACAQGLMVNVRSIAQNRFRIKRGYDLSSDSAFNRFSLLAEHWFSTFYGMYRTPNLRESFRVALLGPKFEEARLYPEFILNQMTTVHGKVKVLQRVYGVWQLHENNEHRTSPVLADVERAQAHYDHFREVLVGALEKVSSVSSHKKCRVIDRYFSKWIYGYGSTHYKLRNKYNKAVTNLRRLLGIVRVNPIIGGFRLAPGSASWNDPAWQLAYHLIREFPQGISEDQAKEQLFELNRAVAA